MQVSSVQFGFRAKGEDREKLIKAAREKLGFKGPITPEMLYVHSWTSIAHDGATVRRNRFAVLADVLLDTVREGLHVTRHSGSTSRKFDAFHLFRVPPGVEDWAENNLTNHKNSPPGTSGMFFRLAGGRKGDTIELHDFAKMDDSEFIQHYRINRAGRRFGFLDRLS